MKDNADIKRRIFWMAGLLTLGAFFPGACSLMPNTSPAKPEPAPFDTPAPATERPAAVTAVTYAPPSEGSLWQAGGSMNMLFINPKARQVGDIVTIKVVESASARNQAETTTDRTSSLSAGVTNFFNAEKRYPANQPFFNPFSKVAGSFESAFEGTGTTKRSGDLTAYITARVVAVLPNGNLKLQGSREVTVNKEKQLITLIGVVRPRDISADNMVMSTYISDAQIIYDGVGIVNDRQKPGWLTALLMKIWPF